ncbi:hypothetical protein BDP27DRAFT_1370458 [Rhodocollybia butyracea]|uniref:F-box domain-containing protein n=1 Tax=Rhodocollybia butyracea TaxID=206335 RepID=A0A9P5TZR3_9AGAR|nr:hypothetical protein BDP27DRAFT_1370458 [Rhodocollybia butyracea]
MTPPCTNCGNPLQRHVNLSSGQLSALANDLRFEFGPFVVTPQRAQEFRTILALGEKDIKDHVSELARLERQRDILSSFLSPIRKLPNETLFRIFQYVCEENLLQCYPWPPGRRPPTKMKSPVITYLPSTVISSVCSRWHALALSSPSLWANLAVETYTTSLDEAENLVGFIDTITRYLERSGDSPLRLALDIQGSWIPHSEEVPSLIHLTQHSPRWKTFKYDGHHFLTWYSLLSQLRCPLLVELDIAIMVEGLNCFKHHPRLTALSTSEPVGKTSKALYNQLHHINFYHHLLTELVDALHSCASLKTLVLGYIYPDLEEGGLGTWRNITSVSLVNGKSSRIVFSSFDFPSLNKLVLDGGHEGGPAHGLVSFISRSSCMITTFTLRGIHLSDLDLVAALRVMPALLHLEVENKLQPDYLPKYQSPVTSHLLSSLTHDHSTSISLIPKLHSLHLTWRFESSDTSDDSSDDSSDDTSDGAPGNNASDDEFDNDFDDTAFVNMVKSRWFKPGSDLAAEMSALGKSCIRSVVLKFPARRVNADIYEPLRILDAEGLRVVVAGTNGVQV